MFGLDDWIAGLSDGASIVVVLFVAVLLGLRHATDPDHIAAMTTLVASGRARASRSAARLGAWWGLGHAIALVLFGVPILLAERYLPTPPADAETAVAALVVFLALRLLGRWRRGTSPPPHPHPEQNTDTTSDRSARSASGSCTGSAKRRRGILLLADPVGDGGRRVAPPARGLHRGLDGGRDRRARQGALLAAVRGGVHRDDPCARGREPVVRRLVRRGSVEPRAVPLLNRRRR
jgi:ABC-type nickel/cobalt efflux system permease component RcnA